MIKLTLTSRYKDRKNRTSNLIAATLAEKFSSKLNRHQFTLSLHPKKFCSVINLSSLATATTRVLSHTHRDAHIYYAKNNQKAFKTSKKV